MKFLVAFVVLSSMSNLLVNADCVAKNKKPCFTKDQMPKGFGSYFASGDPCFLDDDDKTSRWCFTSTGGSMGSCTCTPDCGCDKVTKFPACDNSVVPKNPDCSDDQKTYCPIGKGNTMCQYCGVNTNKCGGICMRGLNDTEIQLVVDTHNNLRRKVAQGLENQGVNGGQPKAADMYQLVWDPALAAVAQRWTDQCTKGHDTDRTSPGYKWVGQNYARNSNSGQSNDKDLVSLIMQWYNEVQYWPAANVNKFTSEGTTGETGHYTQLVWAATKRIGCGYIGNKDDKWFNNILICNYGEGGNYGSNPVYTIGEPGSKCPNGSNDGLCL